MMWPSSPHERVAGSPLWILRSVGLVGFVTILVRTAWLSDEGYITFRVVDNWLNGYGLTWNAAERVCLNVHPLWTLVLGAAFSLTGNVYYTAIGVSVLLALLGAAWLLWRTQQAALILLAVSAICWSKCFTDYSTGGLENPLMHLLLAGFALRYLDSSRKVLSILTLALVTSAFYLCRMDTVLFLLPALAMEVWRQRRKRAVIRSLILGFSPVALWLLFSLFYYGTPFPNVYYAKLNLDIPKVELYGQGLQYLWNSWLLDPVTIPIIGLGILTAFLSKEPRRFALGLGLAGYVWYVVSIGGTFMSGRYLAAPFFLSVLLVVHSAWFAIPLRAALAAGILTVLGLFGPYSPPLSGSDYRVADVQQPEEQILASFGGEHHILDYRGFLYDTTGLLRVLRQNQPRPDFPIIHHPYAIQGAIVANSGQPQVKTFYAIGFYGFFAGPRVHVLDPYALADPLLSRIAFPYSPNWRVGHFERPIPNGYVQTLETGVNSLTDPNIKKYYDVVQLVTRGNLWSWQRLGEVVRWNLGTYDALIEPQRTAVAMH